MKRRIPALMLVLAMLVALTLPAAAATISGRSTTAAYYKSEVPDPSFGAEWA